MAAAQSALLSKPKHMEPSLIEAGARLIEGGTTLTFEGDKRKCPLKIVLKVNNPQFYWKVMTNADLGLADAYIDGDISFNDNNEGLLNLFLVRLI
ncbi:hypothetical protein CFP56_022628 [Quercus suber]|uniref:Uncharacterized protein n=1 Tax=Quercus suber TaxID=58331 RepID=A0AAW0LZU1_QUESU